MKRIWRRQSSCRPAKEQSRINYIKIFSEGHTCVLLILYDREVRERVTGEERGAEERAMVTGEEGGSEERVMAIGEEGGSEESVMVAEEGL